MSEKSRLLYGNVADVNDPLSSSGSAFPLYRELGREFKLAGSIDASMGRFAKRFNDLINFHPIFYRWKERRHKSIPTLNLHSKIACRKAKEFAGDYEFYFQQRALFDPSDWAETPYCIYTDCTHQNTLQNWDKWSPFSQKELKQWLEREKAIYDNATLLFPWSDFAAQSMIHDYGQPPEKVIVAGSGINFTESPQDHGDYDGLTILFVGYDFERKGGPDLLRAFELVKKEICSAQLIIGGPPIPTGAGADGVTWVGSISSRSQMAELYKRASLFVMPSVYEPWGSVYLEAMAHGVPCIAANKSAAPEIITNGVDGALVEPGNIEMLAKAIVDLLSDTQILQSYGAQARAKVLTEFTWEAVVKRIAPHIRRSING